MNPALAQWERLCALKAELQMLDGEAVLDTAFARRHGFFDDWYATVGALPQAAGQGVFSQDIVQVAGDMAAPDRARLADGLRALAPWRKGPFSLFGIHVDSEWRSDFKFARVLELGVDLAGKQVLDVGTGNGYFLYRLLGEGARLAVGLDPSWHCFAQYLAVARYAGFGHSVYLPATLDVLPLFGFDVTFSMGVLYHRRDPLGHLAQLRDTLLPGGTLVLETLVVEGDAQTVLLPAERYAGMRNVWFLPSVAALHGWLARLGFTQIETGPVVATTAEEQRATAWMDRQSLSDFMQAGFLRTKEGLPPPRRAMIRARRAL